MMDLRAKFLACTVLVLLNVVAIAVGVLYLGIIGLLFAGLFFGLSVMTALRVLAQ